MGRESLPTKVGEGEETMVGAETFLVFAVAAFDLTVVTGRAGTDELVDDAKPGSCTFKRRREMAHGIGETVGGREAVVGLDTFGLHAFACQGSDDLSREIS